MSWRELRELARPADPEASPPPGVSRQVAVALRYAGQDPAPRLIAKGRGVLADSILRVAEAHGVPIKSDPDLTTLLEALELYQEIPPDLYKVVATLLAWLYAANAALADA